RSTEQSSSSRVPLKTLLEVSEVREEVEQQRIKMTRSLLGMGCVRWGVEDVGAS
ncbi:hypothetical protein THAOC_03971, partial [Thalassiosira oceanica]